MKQLLTDLYKLHRALGRTVEYRKIDNLKEEVFYTQGDTYSLGMKSMKLWNI